MTHDFAKQRAARASRAARPSTPGWLWFVTGVICGTLGSFLVYLATLAPHPRATTQGAPPVASAQAPGAAATTKPAEKPQFDFYTILPESEVIVGERPAETPPPAAKPAEPERAHSTEPATASVAAKPKPAETPKAPSLLLQAGSFRQFAEADRRRANIILLGYHARVETVSMRGGETWYRVQVGPFTDSRALGEARGALRDQGIESVEIGKRA